MSVGAFMACVGTADDATRQHGQPALVIDGAGTLTIASPWQAPYHIVDNHCHNAAAQNCSNTDGYIACQRLSSHTWNQGHTINWTVDPRARDGRSFCAYEPQRNGGTLADGSICCWTGAVQNDGTPDLTDLAAQPCILSLCGGQARYSPFSSPPVAHPPGQQPQVAAVCSQRATREDCARCCDKQRDAQEPFRDDPDRGADYLAQMIEYTHRCRMSCGSLPIASSDTLDLTRPGSNDSRGVAYGRFCVSQTTRWSLRSRLQQCLDCCTEGGFASPPGSNGTTSCEAVCNAAYR